MPTNVITQVDPLDLQGNIAIGISLPFNGPAGPFNSTYSTQDQIKSNFINLLLTNKGERIYNPNFGADLKKVLFEGVVGETETVIRSLITTNTTVFVPEITINNITFSNPTSLQTQNNTISVTIIYTINISGNADQITVQFI
jgi:phage baseplate assembly protein W